MNIITLDIGGTAVKYGLFFRDKEEFGQFSVYDSEGTENNQKNLYDFLDNYTADRVAISVPGPFDFKTGTSNMKHKLTSLYGISLKDKLEEKFPDTTVIFIHDSVSFAYGVLHEKPELACDSFSCIMLGTGIGYVNVVNGAVQLNENCTPLNPLWNMNYLDGIAEDYISTNAFGENLGKCIEVKRKEDNFNQVVIGGQISRSFDLMRSGFEAETDIKYTFVSDPSRCALYGLKAYTENVNTLI